MKSLFFTISGVLLLTFYSCADYEPLKYGFTSNKLIQSEYKYGDNGGTFSISGAFLSVDEKTIGFHGIFGYKNTINTIVGELSINGELLWKNTIEQTTDSLLQCIKTKGGFLFYESDWKNTNETCPLYFASSSKQSLVQLSLPQINGQPIKHIYHIEYLTNEKSLIRVYTNNALYTNAQSYFATFTIEDNAFILTSDWISYSYSLNILAIQQTADDCVEIVGFYGFPYNPFLSIQKIKLTATSVEYIWITQEKVEIDWGMDMTIKFCSSIQENLLYFYYRDLSSDRFACLDIDNGNLTSSSKRMGGVPNKFIFYNDVLYTIHFFYYWNEFTSDNKETRGLPNVCLIEINNDDGFPGFSDEYSFGSETCLSKINDAFVYKNQLFLFGFTDKKYTSNHELVDWLIPYDGCKGWFFKINLSDLDLQL